MKLLRFLALASALMLAACATDRGTAHHRVGATSTIASSITWVSVPAITGNNATVILYDTTAGTSNHQTNIWVSRVIFSGRCDQPVTLLYQVERTGSSTWRTMNGSGGGDVMPANTDTAIDYLILGPDSRLEAVTGATGPSTCEVDVGLYGDRTLGM